ncbi:MAG: Ig-like domain-containing protein [Firmicutes bacterium]|nr:Ig-like domain-containing protein [Bacillota bacterium]
MAKKIITMLITFSLLASSFVCAQAPNAFGGLVIGDLAYNGSGAQPQVVYGYEDGSGGLIGGRETSGTQLFLSSAVFLLDTPAYRLPDLLKGQTFIRVDGKNINDKKSTASDFLCFTTNRDVTVYIGMESRTLAQIAENGNTSPVAEYIRTEDEGGSPVAFWGNGGIKFEVYQKDYDAGDTITISGNAATNSDCIPYVPIIVPKATLSASCLHFAEGEEISDISNNEGKQVEASFSFINTTGAPADAVLLTCAYIGKMLVDIKMKNISAPLGNSIQKNHSINIPSDPPFSFTIKSFAWTRLSEMVSLTAQPSVLTVSEGTVDPNSTVMLLAGSPIAFVDNLQVRINKDDYIAETAPTHLNGEVMAPIGFISDALGAVLQTDGVLGADFLITLGRVKIALTLGEPQMLVNGQPVNLAVAPVEIDGVPMTALAPIAFAFNKFLYQDARGLNIISADNSIFNDETNPDLINRVIKAFDDQANLAVEREFDKVLYVSAVGNDSNNGLTEDKPFGTIQKAMDNASAGTKIIVKNGIYHESITVKTSGTCENPIVVEAESRFGAVITGDGTVRRLVIPSTVGGVISQYITFRGFIFSNTYADETTVGTPAVRITNGWRLEDCKIENVGMQGFISQPEGDLQAVDDVAVLRTVVQDTGGKTMGTVGARNSLIKDVIIRRGNQKLLSPVDDGAGFKNVRSQSETINAMTAYDHNGNSMWYDLWNTNFIVKNSSSFANHGFVFAGSPEYNAAGIMMEISQGPAKFYNNLFHSNTGAGIHFAESKNLTAYNNTVFKNWSGAVWLRDGDRGISANFEKQGWDVGARIGLGAANFYNNKIQSSGNAAYFPNRIYAFYCPSGVFDKGNPSAYGLNFNSNIFEPGTGIFSWLQNGQRETYSSVESIDESWEIGDVGYHEKFLEDDGSFQGIAPFNMKIGPTQIDRSTEYATIDSAIAPYDVGDSMPVPIFRRSEIRGTDNNWHAEVFDLQGRAMALHIKSNELKAQFENEVSVFTNIYPKYATVTLTSDSAYDFRAELVGNFTENPPEYGTVSVTEPKGIDSHDRFPFAWGEPFTVKAEASAAAGVKSVEFYVENALVGRADTAPYEATVQNLTPGEYFLTARVTDMNGATSISKPVRIGVRKDLKVNGAVTQKLDGLGKDYEDAVWIKNVAVSLNLDVNQDVLIFIAGNGISVPEYFVQLDESVMLDNVTYQVYGRNFPEGTVQIPRLDGNYAVGILGMGNAALVEEIKITYPEEGTQVRYGEDSIFKVEVVNGNPNGKVEIYNQDEKLGEAIDFPYTVNTGTLPVGKYKIIAKKIDRRGRSAQAELNYSVGDDNSLWVTNFTSRNNYPYEVVYDGLKPDIGVFVGRNDWVIKEVPEEFIGKTFIKGADKHRNNKTLGTQVAFDINMECEVYVVFPDSAYKTSWLDDWEELEYYKVQPYYDVIYHKRFEAGRVALGPTAATMSDASYFIIVVPTQHAAPPAITAVNPTQNALTLENGSLECHIKAMSPGGAISKIEAFEGNVKLAETSVSPYRLFVSGLSKGSHSIVFKATDDKNNTALTEPINVNVVADDRLVISNLAVANGSKPPFPIMYNSLKQGSYLYHTNAVKAGGLPSHLINATYLMPDSKLKNNSSEDLIKFDVNQQVTVYIAFDKRTSNAIGYIQPEWIKGFVETEHTMGANPVYTFFKKDFPEGTIVLGGNAGVTSGCVQYIPIILPKEG